MLKRKNLGIKMGNGSLKPYSPFAISLEIVFRFCLFTEKTTGKK